MFNLINCKLKDLQGLENIEFRLIFIKNCYFMPLMPITNKKINCLERLKKGFRILLNIFKIERHEVEHLNMADGELQTIVQMG